MSLPSHRRSQSRVTVIFSHFLTSAPLPCEKIGFPDGFVTAAVVVQYSSNSTCFLCKSTCCADDVGIFSTSFSAVRLTRLVSLQATFVASNLTSEPTRFKSARDSSSLAPFIFKIHAHNEKPFESEWIQMFTVLNWFYLILPRLGLSLVPKGNLGQATRKQTRNLL